MAEIITTAEASGKNLKYPEWLRWISFAASLAILVAVVLIPVIVLGQFDDGTDVVIIIDRTSVIIFISAGILPALLAAVLSVARKFWWLLVPGIWFEFMVVWLRQNDPSDLLLVMLALPALVLLFTPIVGVFMRRSDSDHEWK